MLLLHFKKSLVTLNEQARARRQSNRIERSIIHSHTQSAIQCRRTTNNGGREGPQCRRGVASGLHHICKAVKLLNLIGQLPTFSEELSERAKLQNLIQRLCVIWGQCCLRVGASPCLPNSPITQLSPYLTRNPCKATVPTAKVLWWAQVSFKSPVCENPASGNL